MSKVFDFDGLPKGVKTYVEEICPDAAWAQMTIDFVRGELDRLPESLQTLRIQLEAWRGEYFGRREMANQMASCDPLLSDIERLRAIYGLWSIEAYIYINAYLRAAQGKENI